VLRGLIANVLHCVLARPLLGPGSLVPAAAHSNPQR